MPTLAKVSVQLDSVLENTLEFAKTTADEGSPAVALQTMEALLRVVADSLGSEHPQAARIHHELGNLFNNHFQNRARALEHFQQATNLRQYWLEAVPALRPELAKSYFALARVQRLSGQLQAALENVRTCLTLREEEQPQDTLRLAAAYLETGILSRETGDLDNSLRYLRQASALLDSAANSPAGRLASAWNELATTHDLLRQPAQALKFYQKSLDAWRSAGDTASLSLGLVNLGGAYLRSGVYPQAERAFRQAAVFYEKLLAADTADMNLRMAQSAVWGNLGILFKRTGRSQQALAAAEKSLSLALRFAGTPYHPEVAGSYDNLGNVQAGLGQDTAALEAYQSGIRALTPGFTAAGFFPNPSLENNGISEKPLLFTLLKDKTEALRRFGVARPDSLRWLAAAFRTCLTMDTLLLQMRQSCREDGSKYFIGEEAHPVYEQALDLTFGLWKTTGDTTFRNAALTFCGRSKAGVLLEALNDAQVKRLGNVSAGAIVQENALRQAIAQQELRLYQAGEGASTPLHDSLFLLKQQLEKLTRRLEQEAPRYFEQKFALAQAVEPAALQAVLPPGRAMVEFFPGDSLLFTICLTKQSFYLYRTPLPPDFLQRISRLRRSLSDWDFISQKTGEAERDYLENARFLYDFLLRKPLEDVAAEDIRALTLVPGGPLGYLSFDVLLTTDATSWKDRKLPCLLRRYAIGYVYAAGFLLQRKERQRQRPRYNFAGFGLTYDQRTLQAMSAHPALLSGSRAAIDSMLAPQAGHVADSLNLPGSLPYSSDEVASISRVWKGRCWLDSAATRENFLTFAAQADVLHFAGHGFTDAGHPLNSSLLFFKTTDTAECLLRAADLYGRPLHGRMAVLSACNTGYGELQRGEGIMSFARAFSYAGVPSLVMSLWSITDAGTAGIMKHFYQNLRAGSAKDEALQRAKLAWLEAASPENSLPAYWAGTVLTGDISPLTTGSESKPAIWLLLLLLPLAGVLFWRKKRRI